MDISQSAVPLGHCLEEAARVTREAAASRTHGEPTEARLQAADAIQRVQTVRLLISSFVAGLTTQGKTGAQHRRKHLYRWPSWQIRYGKRSMQFGW
jgi:hypothetical protein